MTTGNTSVSGIWGTVVQYQSCINTVSPLCFVSLSPSSIPGFYTVALYCTTFVSQLLQAHTLFKSFLPQNYIPAHPNNSQTFKMKYSTAILALVATVSAQSIADLPTCGVSCLATGISTIGCTLTDFKCSCGKAEQLTAAVTPCVKSSCSAADEAKLKTVLGGICAAAGVPITLPAPSSAAPVKSSAAPVASSAAPVKSSAASGKFSYTAGIKNLY
ncbi:hypothetical protein BCR34DRAFT_554479 [Clohesyomyces aquaticus]|uniref:CFEM domain-containing protein n=1 Tax=Clohesyomyces aquaticus TaxID=1231657 RepID=A0A1Y2A8A2_9PLEO|nr:hypothetical protein BCR34DRAFT_554479 [Clohesyomyces aquaticus]